MFKIFLTLATTLLLMSAANAIDSSKQDYAYNLCEALSPNTIAPKICREGIKNIESLNFYEIAIKICHTGGQSRQNLGLECFHEANRQLGFNDEVDLFDCILLNRKAAKYQCALWMFEQKINKE